MMGGRAVRGAGLEVLRIRPRRGLLGLDLRALWEYRELLYFLLWRDLKVRYKQTVLGAAWAVLQPVATVAVFAAVFGAFAGLPSDGEPYVVYAYSALLPWNLLAGAINRSGTSLVSNTNLISKVYFPRVLIPLSGALGSLVDFAISLAVLLAIILGMGRQLSPNLLALPVLALGVLLLGTAIGMGLSAVNVRYRDVAYLIGFLLQIWMYASPVAYSASIVPDRWMGIYTLNPMVGYIQGFRWSLLGHAGPVGVPWFSAVLLTVGLLLAALIYFRQVERWFADII